VTALFSQRARRRCCRNLFRDITKTKLKNAEALAERLAYLNGVPPNKIEPAHAGITLVEMVKEDVQAEEETAN